jgi:nitrite reductase/ring-hydroxylating ferredoxin subunit
MIEGMEIVCPYHMGSFDVRTGEPVKSPCSIPIKSYATEVRDGVLYALIQPM